jgi:hypothetical protein
MPLDLEFNQIMLDTSLQKMNFLNSRNKRKKLLRMRKSRKKKSNKRKMLINLIKTKEVEVELLLELVFLRF